MIKKIKIGWKEYAISKADAVLNSGEELYGQINHIAGTITLRGANDEEQDRVTLLHEVLHGIDVMYSIGMEEEMVERIANALYTVMKDNGLEVRRNG